MPYVVKYDDITNLWFAANGKFGEWNESCGSITESLNAFVEMDSFKGKTAESVKAYISEVHYSALISIAEILAEYQSRFLLYKDGWHQQVDNHLHSDLREEVLDGLKDYFKQSYLDFLDEAENVRSIAASVSDLVPASFPHEASVDADYTATNTRLSTLLTNMGDYESSHYRTDFTHLDTLINALNTFLKHQLAQDTGYMVSYETGMVEANPGFEALVYGVNDARAEREALQEDLARAMENEQSRFEALEAEWAKQRQEQGILAVVVSTLIVVGGVVCIVATAGIATPVVAPAVATGIGIAGGIVGGATIVYGASNFIEGTQDIYYGSVGDYSTAAWNPVRDTVFMGNQQAYDIFGTVCVISSSVLSLGAGAIGAAGAATSAGTSTARAVAVYGAKTVATAGAGAAGGWAGKTVALELGASETMAQVWGIAGGVVAGAAAGFGAQALDQKYNWSGYHRVQTVSNPENLKPSETDPSGYEIDWDKAPENGYTLKEDGTAIRDDNYVPKKGDMFDRYRGVDDGTYVSPMEDGVSASYDSRSMPYEENPYALQRYKVIRDFSELPDAINNLPEGELRDTVMNYVNNRWNGDLNNMRVYTGTAAQAFQGTGGAPQAQFPLLCEDLIKLGFLANVTPIPVDPSLYASSGLGTIGGIQIGEEE